MGRALGAARRAGSLRRLARVTTAAVVTVALMAGCHLPGLGSGLEQTAITVAALRAVDDAPVYLAASKGLFRAQGLDVTVRTFGSAQQELQALNAGQVDVAAGSDTAFFQAEADGDASLRMVADGYQAAPNVVGVLAKPGSGIIRPQDLAGKRIATPLPDVTSASAIGNIEQLTTIAVLQSDTVDPGTIRWEPMPAPDMTGALRDGRVDAILATEPYITDAERNLGAVEILDSCSGPTANEPLSGYFSLSPFALDDPDTLRSFQSALVKAQAMAAGPAAAQDALSYAGIDPATASLISVGVYPTSLDAGRLQGVADLMFQSGMIARPVNVSAMIFN
jgi:NitT/TauT family transport system substrate-binding protein